LNRRLALKMFAATAMSDFAGSAACHAEDEILELDCADLLARIRDGSLRAEQVCAKFLQQYERQRFLNVVTWMDPSNVLSRAREIDRTRDKGSPLPALAGLPILVKDNIDTIGFPTSAGAECLKRHFPQRNAPAIERLLENGAILFGKANMHQFGSGVTSSNPTFGFVRNPYDLDLIPGGSSGGSAAAIGARIVPAALGTDTGGSVRIPAAFCGIVGFRPSIYPRRLYSLQGVVPHTPDLDTIGPMGRCVADVTILHAAVTGQVLARPQSIENVRIGVPILSYWDDLDAEVECVAQAALSRLRDHGATLVEIDLRKVKDRALHIHSALQPGAIPDLESFVRTLVPSVSPRDPDGQIASCDFWAWVEGRKRRIGAAKANSDLLSAASGGHRDALRAAYHAVFRQHGIQAVVFPTVVLPPPPIQAAADQTDDLIEFNGRTVSKTMAVLRNVLQAGPLGAPALSLPAGLTSNGLPVGLEFDGLPGGDSALLALCRAAEAAIGRVPAPPLVVRVSTAC
jgi:indoleacetamide hydrolase